MRSAKELTLFFFLYSSLPRQPNPAPSRPAQPRYPTNKPGLPCPRTGNLRESSGLVRLWHASVPKIICKHQAGTCKFIDLHLNQRPNNQIIHMKKREGGELEPAIKHCCCCFRFITVSRTSPETCRGFYCSTENNVSL